MSAFVFIGTNKKKHRNVHRLVNKCALEFTPADGKKRIREPFNTHLVFYSKSEYPLIYYRTK